jgi:hypothetical protein
MSKKVVSNTIVEFIGYYLLKIIQNIYIFKYYNKEQQREFLLLTKLHLKFSMFSLTLIS